jgi:SAM-dependent methyltransferase
MTQSDLDKRKGTVTCGICRSPARETVGSFEGFKAGQFFDLYECQACRTAFCYPLEVDPEIYKEIYLHGETMPGYNRYHAYFRAVKNEESPLEFLAKQEDCYWFIDNYLRNHVDKQQAKLLEVGSGLGYLTYSLDKSGYNIQGVELSSVAVEEATKQFGNLYRCEDALMLADDGERFDVILLTEVIEHLIQPATFVRQLGKLLNPGGCILVTTPNKDWAPNKLSPWGTDLPPVHLWWFTKEGFNKIAEAADLSVSFYSFRDWHKWNFPRRLLKPAKLGNLPQRMKMDGTPIKPKRKSLKPKRFTKRLKSLINYVRYRDAIDIDDGAIIGAVFKQ